MLGMHLMFTSVKFRGRSDRNAHYITYIVNILMLHEFFYRMFCLSYFHITRIFSYPYLICLRIMMKMLRIAHLFLTMETAWG